MPRIRVFTSADLDGTADAARGSARLRSNLNVHPGPDDPIQRFLNILQPGTYVRPHRHAPHRFELFLVLAGRAGVLTFDDDGLVLERVVADRGTVWAVEIPGGVWHTIIALAPDTMLFEIKAGPFTPIDDKDFAQWAPREGETAAEATRRRWEEDLAGPVNDPTR